ncbi:histidine--tRNA ligase [Streptomyces sp. SL13]|uniref:Histidine--tRNA ligase n=1 Tax=Streptantibioticus silvisoli TaxID=2705255 RepID=A0AA90K8Y4_9ACTN|nr:histidine--tRNA ligase [Streptantibioticus silvisoli]MDI5963960.1 histidine--tRNA ligase [Streptantibioticus silvisoli]MDI5970077.1 histidine--tRNA ligase [Streptantibioticus silvisoli]
MGRLLPTTPYRGTRDFLPSEMSVRQQVFHRLYDAIERFGFVRYDGPILESAEIYEAKSGQEIADQQLYSLTDRGDRRLALRPEMTPSVARMIAGNAGQLQFPVRWYSHVICHRYERPQRGRMREHLQINVDIFGSDSVNCEIEIFELIHDMMSAVGATRDMWVLRVGDRALLESILTDVVGVPADRLQATTSLIDRWAKSSPEQLVADAGALGIDEKQFGLLDDVLNSGSAVLERVSDEARERSMLARVLKSSAADLITFDPFIVRGLQYYTGTVFEVFDQHPKNNRSLFGGGRYEDLAGLFTTKRIPGIGFGMGDVTLHDFLEGHGLLPTPRAEVDVVVIPLSPDLATDSRIVAHDLRQSGTRVSTPLEPRKLSKELARSDASGARVAVIIAPDEWERGMVAVRDLTSHEQTEVSAADVVAEVNKLLRC